MLFPGANMCRCMVYVPLPVPVPVRTSSIPVVLDCRLQQGGHLSLERVIAATLVGTSPRTLCRYEGSYNQTI